MPWRTKQIMGTLATVLIAACDTSNSAGVASGFAPPAPSAQFYPAWAYTAKVLFPGQYSVATAVNDVGQIAGHLSGSAFLLDPGGAPQLLPLNGATRGTATDITAHGVVSGSVLRGGARYPAVWTSPFLAATELRSPGGVSAINDRLEAVGAFDRKGFPRPMFWDVRGHASVSLPVPAGTTQGFATDINNDGVVVGEVDGSGAMWTRNGTGWTYRKLKGIRPWGIDGGYGTTGWTAFGQAVRGNPDVSGAFPTTGLAVGWRVNGWGVSVGEDWNMTTNVMQAWVGDAIGNFTYLPLPPGGAPSASARAINNCGLVVGFVMTGSMQEAATWDPGC